MALPTPQNPFVRSGIRLSVAMVVADCICVLWFKDNPAALFTAFATLILLYFLDFEGGPAQRLLAYGAASIVGLLGIVIGTLAAPVTWLAIVITVPVSFAFAYARVLKGFIARCAVGLQLSFFIPVMLPATPADLNHYLGAWLLGCVIATVAAMTILPRQNLTRTRDALAQWCTAASDMTRLFAQGVRSGEGRKELEAAHSALAQMSIGNPTRPGALMKRLRALLEMVQYANAATTLATTAGTAPLDSHSRSLAQASGEAFDGAARTLDRGQQPAALIDIDAARERDLAEAQSWCASGLNKNPAATLEELRDHYPIRLIAILSGVIQWLALQSRGISSPMPQLGAYETSTPMQLLRANFSINSPWFRNALRTGIAAAVAVGIVQVMGLDHGFWVVLATISILQLSFSSPGTGRLALRAVTGTVAGLVIGAAVIILVPNQTLFIVLLAVAAFLAKYAQGKSYLAGQFAFTPLSIINVSLLTWPPSTDTIASRFIDVLIGVAVAIGLTLAIFPRGITRLIGTTGNHAVATMQAYVDAARDAVTGRTSLESLVAKRQVALRALQAYDDTLDAAFMTSQHITPHSLELQARQGWAQDALLGGDVIRLLAAQRDEVVHIPEMVAALDLPSGDRLTRMRQVVMTDHVNLAAHPQAFVSAVWSGWWLDFLDRTRPVDSELKSSA